MYVKVQGQEVKYFGKAGKILTQEREMGIKKHDVQ